MAQENNTIEKHDEWATFKFMMSFIVATITHVLTIILMYYINYDCYSSASCQHEERLFKGPGLIVIMQTTYFCVIFFPFALYLFFRKKLNKLRTSIIGSLAPAILISFSIFITLLYKNYANQGFQLDFILFPAYVFIVNVIPFFFAIFLGLSVFPAHKK